MDEALYSPALCSLYEYNTKSVRIQGGLETRLHFDFAISCRQSLCDVLENFVSEETMMWNVNQIFVYLILEL